MIYHKKTIYLERKMAQEKSKAKELENKIIEMKKVNPIQKSENVNRK